MRIVDVRYEGEEVHLITDSHEYTLPYTPRILFDPAILPLIHDALPSYTRLKYAIEVRAPLDVLLDLHRTLSRLTPRVLFIEPERQFLLEKHVSIGTSIQDGSPSLSPPSFESADEALAYLLRSTHGYPPRVFLENIAYLANYPLDLSPAPRLHLPAHTLHVLLDANLSPETLNCPCCRKNVLPSSLVRFSLPTPTLFHSYLPVDVGLGVGVVEYGDDALGILADAVALNVPHRIVHPTHVCSKHPGFLPLAILRLLRLAHNALSLLHVRGSDIVSIARASASAERLSAYYLLDAIAHIILPLPSLLASTHALTEDGRRAFLVLSSLLLRSPELYKRLRPHTPICSRASNELEYFLRELSNLLSELPHLSTYLRV